MCVKKIYLFKSYLYYISIILIFIIFFTARLCRYLSLYRYRNFRSTEDCVNGTLLGEIPIPEPSINFTSFLKIYEKSMQHPADPTNVYVPAQKSLTIYNSSRLYINLERCVNTLKGECRQFQLTHGRDGDNKTAQSRYPCYYNKVRHFLSKDLTNTHSLPDVWVRIKRIQLKISFASSNHAF